MSKCLTSCRTCCKFKKEDAYFSPKITPEEIERIQSAGFYKKVFYPFENSKTIFQIELLPSKNSKEFLVCPYLNEKTQQCIIHDIKPFDCLLWPFSFIEDETGQKILFVHTAKNNCQNTETLSEAKFKHYLTQKTEEWIKKNYPLRLIQKYPELVWAYRSDVIVLKSWDKKEILAEKIPHPKKTGKGLPMIP